MPLITAKSLRNEVSEHLRAWIIEGHLAAGARIVEADMTDRLGVSRTPLREALLGLEKEGLVQSVTNKGFHVSPLDPQEVMDLYPILGALEAAAVQIGGLQLQSSCQKLRQINHQIQAGGSSRTLYRLDMQWHGILWKNCSNQHLVNLIESLGARVRRFDGAFERGMADIPNSYAEHEEITHLIEKGEIEAAATKIELHWQNGIKVVLGWIEKQTKVGGAA